ncbi:MULTISPECIES: winged helix-turn-helix domain-containing protein [unclassified Nocardioides]|uniref:winged helix-turn-helix domain-containing protein n=1 Tax=unclassified Nocardioides TaxID=2615069 RepID=UPI0006F3F8D6|nr:MULTISPECIES: helix-turn-helix domain-containing protein [unclassified Nocardioides]KRA38619.1 ArsR family transcriptional regulator [Nocardioides sp. Root614]KRA92579.1 ArsR family transcriptional regulator [Nocardioides sp. Root682]
MVMYDDPRILRAIAHPTRNRVLHELSAAGSLRAADVARRIDVPANQASFHLRQLAKYGLVEEDPEAGRDKRDRVWRLVDPDGIRFRTSDMLARPGGRAAYTVFQRNAIEWGRHLVERALDQTETPVRKSVSEWSLLLSADESEQLLEELSEVIERYRDAGRTGGPDADRETYSVFQLIQPYPELPVPDEA